MLIRVVRRPAFPGEFNHEKIWPLVFIGAIISASFFFYLGGATPGCLFYYFTGIPCLGCGATRCTRALINFEFWTAFKYHPIFFLSIIGLFTWTIYAGFFWIRRDTLRIRIVVDEATRPRLWALFFIVVIAHWIWQCYYLPHCNA